MPLAPGIAFATLHFLCNLQMCQTIKILDYDEKACQGQPLWLIGLINKL